MDFHARTALNASMARLADGDRGAFAGVYESLWPVLRRFCTRALRSDADGQDAAQQALLKVFARASTYDSTRDAITWALSIAAWECRTVRRRADRSKTVPLGDAEHVDEQPSPESLVATRDLESAAAEVLGALSEVDCETLLSTFDEDAPRPQIAAASFRKRRERAIARLREAWSKLYGAR